MRDGGTVGNMPVGLCGFDKVQLTGRNASGGLLPATVGKDGGSPSVEPRQSVVSPTGIMYLHNRVGKVAEASEGPAVPSPAGLSC